MTRYVEGSDLSTIAKRELEEAFEDYDGGRFESALRRCDAILAHVPSQADAHNLRGVVLEELDRPEEAVDAYRMAIDLDPDFAEARQNLRDLGPELAKRYLAQACEEYDGDRFGAALRYCDMALELDPLLAEAYNLLGMVLEELDRPGAAAEAYRQAIELGPGFAEARANWRELEVELAEKRRLVTVATFLNGWGAHVARASLEGAGIPSFLADEQMATLLGAIGFHWLKLQVAEEDAGEALEFLDWEPEPGQHEWGKEGGQPQCPHCGSYHTRYETYNVRLAFLAISLGFFPLLITKLFFVLLLLASPFLIPMRAWTCLDCGHDWKLSGATMSHDHGTEGE